MRLFKFFVWSVFLFEFESMTIKNNEEKFSVTVEIWFIRRVHGQQNDEYLWILYWTEIVDGKWQTWHREDKDDDL